MFRCKRCWHPGPFQIVIIDLRALSHEGVVSESDMENTWDSTDEVTCPECNLRGTADDFRED